MKTPFLSKSWMSASEDLKTSQIALVGLPFDGTCSFRPGSRFASGQIRLASIGIETYSPYFDKDLEDISFCDCGDVDLPFGNTVKALDMIETCAKEMRDAGKIWFGVGGEHLVTYPAFKSYFDKYPDLFLIHFDAHTDLREHYLGEKLSHASVIKRIAELTGFENICQIGIRSGEKAEFDLMKRHNTLIKTISEFSQRLEKIGTRPIYLTVDADVLDPSIFPGTGTPEPGGFTFSDLIDYFKILKGKNIVACDLNELSPMCDLSGNSTVVAAKIIREMLCLIDREGGE